MATQVHLRVVGPKGGVVTELDVDAETMTGSALKALLAETVDLPPERQDLVFQNGSRNAAKASLEDAATLAAQSVTDGAIVTARPVEARVERQDSALRQNIQKNAGLSYYYAHASEGELAPEHRYAYGGAPVLMEAEVAAPSAPERLTTVITSYSWADEGESVRIYIDEAEAVAAARDGKGGEVTTEFTERSAQLVVQGETRDYALRLGNLEGSIVAESSKHRVSTGKRVTLTLTKARKVTWTRLLRPK